MYKKIIIGIEGISYAGKTTLCNFIEANHPNYQIVYESPKFVNIKIKITENRKEIIANSSKTLEIESLRTESVKKSSKNVFFYDRTIFSFLAISYAYLKTGMVNYFNKYLDRIVDGIENDLFLIPDYLIYLKISGEELKLRKENKKKCLPDYWESKEFNDSITLVLDKIADLYLQQNRIINADYIDKSNIKKMSKMDKNLVLQTIRRFKV